jgi:hypothetical protein
VPHAAKHQYRFRTKAPAHLNGRATNPRAPKALLHVFTRPRSRDLISFLAHSVPGHVFLIRATRKRDSGYGVRARYLAFASGYDQRPGRTAVVDQSVSAASKTYCVQCRSARGQCECSTIGNTTKTMIRSVAARTFKMRLARRSSGVVRPLPKQLGQSLAIPERYVTRPVPWQRQQVLLVSRAGASARPRVSPFKRLTRRSRVAALAASGAGAPRTSCVHFPPSHHRSPAAPNGSAYQRPRPAMPPGDFGTSSCWSRPPPRPSSPTPAPSLAKRSSRAKHTPTEPDWNISFLARLSVWATRNRLAPGWR